MGINVWMRDDVRNMLMALTLSGAQLPQATDAESLAFREGFSAALAATAVGFGINPADLTLENAPAWRYSQLLPVSHLVERHMR